MTPQEQDLITALLNRLRQAANQPKDPQADTLIGSAMAAQPDAPYLLVQTVLIQDMSLAGAQQRITELERQLAEAKAAAGPAASTSFLGAQRASVPSAGPWSAPAQAASPAPVWTQSAAAPTPPMMAQPMMTGPWQTPWGVPGVGSGFLQQAMATAAGVAGGALLFEGLQSMFGPHYAPMLGGMPMQPGIGETVINNYYGDAYGNPPPGEPVSGHGDSNGPGFERDAGTIQANADLPSDLDFGSGQDFVTGQDFATGQDFGGDSSFDV